MRCGLRWLAALLWLGLACAQAGQGEGDAARGRRLYLGDEVLQVQAEDGSGRALPQAACVQCHRRSGLGSFEGALAAPPIAGALLFQAYDRDTFQHLRSQRRDRVRPAYDEAALQALLVTGVAPDGYQVRAPMPRYVLAPQQAADLAAYLRGLAQGGSPGVQADRVHLATVFTPEADPAAREAMSEVLRRFVQLKNAQSRHDPQRARQAARGGEMAMNTKYRHWVLQEWHLQGEPTTWGEQLRERQRQQPVFALVAGMGRQWQPVHEFCEQQQLPCLLPWVAQAPVAAHDTSAFYGLYFHAGWSLELPLALAEARHAGARAVQLWHEGPAPAGWTDWLQAAGLAQAGPQAPGPAPQGDTAVLSLLAPAQHLQRLQHEAAAGALAGRFVAWLPGPVAVDEAQWAAAAQAVQQGLMVTPWRPGATAQRWPRTRQWLRQQGLAELPVEVAAATLQAATALGDALTHIDFQFNRDYVLELLEHGLENLLPFGPYDRLAIAPGQRVAVKGSHAAPVRQGRLQPWQWRVAP
jgi:cytochrome c553